MENESLNVLNNVLPTQSSELKELFSALAKAQAEMPIADKKSANPYFKTKYADLVDIVKASRPCLTKYGLSILQPIGIHPDGTNVLTTILGHSSGQWISSQLRITPPKSDVQTLGSYITYLRRYALASLIGVVASEEDDDAESVFERENLPKNNNDITRNKLDNDEFISKDQIEQLQHELKNFPDIAEDIMAKMKISSLSQIPKLHFFRFIDRIREIKSLRTTK